tara:strand:+ start:313 stop:615 length:303 start_codon:yes stop_codon:yes gene_type:complete
MKNKRLSKQVKKIINNKTVHIEMPGLIHRKLRAKLFLEEMSMQKFFRLMAEKYVNDDNYINDLVSERIEEIKNKEIDNLKEINEKDLYSAIEQNSPFKEN